MANQSALRSDTASNQGGSSEMAGIIDQQAKEIHQLKEKIEITEKESISLKSELYKYKNQIVTIDDHDIKMKQQILEKDRLLIEANQSLQEM